MWRAPPKRECYKSRKEAGDNRDGYPLTCSSEFSTGKTLKAESEHEPE
jgi:hypothetical protein